MPARLHHEQLEVYQRAIAFVAQSGKWIDNIPSNPSVSLQLLRAAESVPLNIAASNTHQSARLQTQALDVAAGSVAECAAALDVMHAWSFLCEKTHHEGKTGLLSIYRMTLGLARSKHTLFEEEPADYARPCFPHERMECYQTALSVVCWVADLTGRLDLPRRCTEALDRASTAMTLNLAEGNARRHPKDKARFLNISLTSALRVSAHLDIAEARGWVTREQIMKGKECITAIVPQIAGLKRHWLETSTKGSEDYDDD